MAHQVEHVYNGFMLAPRFQPKAGEGVGQRGHWGAKRRCILNHRIGNFENGHEISRCIEGPEQFAKPEKARRVCQQ